MYVIQSPDNDIYIENYGVGGDVLACKWAADRWPPPAELPAHLCYRFRADLTPNQENASRGQALQAAERFAREESTARGVPYVAPVGGVLIPSTPGGEAPIVAGQMAQPLDPLVGVIVGRGVSSKTAESAEARVVSSAWRCAMEGGGFHYGDEVDVGAAFTGVGRPSRGVKLMASGEGVFVEWVPAESLTAFLSRGVRADARILPVQVNRRGERDRSIASIEEDMHEEHIPGFPKPRTVEWCIRHLAAEGRNLEAHFEHFKNLTGVQAQQWGVEEYSHVVSALGAFLCKDQLDPGNSIGIELLFRRLQLIEYSYMDKVRERTVSTSGKLTVEEQAAFGAATRMEAKLMICPALLEAAKVETEREAGLSKALLKAREARASLAKK
eukprot:880873-Amphidinium_carterae.6